MAGAFSYIENLMSEASLHQGQDQKNKDMMNPTAQENCRQPNQVSREQSWAKLLRSLTVNSLSYFVKTNY